MLTALVTITLARGVQGKQHHKVDAEECAVPHGSEGGGFRRRVGVVVAFLPTRADARVEQHKHCHGHGRDARHQELRHEVNLDRAPHDADCAKNVKAHESQRLVDAQGERGKADAELGGGARNDSVRRGSAAQ